MHEIANSMAQMPFQRLTRHAHNVSALDAVHQLLELGQL